MVCELNSYSGGQSVTQGEFRWGAGDEGWMAEQMQDEYVVPYPKTHIFHPQRLQFFKDLVPHQPLFLRPHSHTSTG